MSSKLFPGDPSKVMVIRKVTPEITTFSVPFSRFGLLKFGGRGTLGNTLIYPLRIPSLTDPSKTTHRLPGNHLPSSLNPRSPRRHCLRRRENQIYHRPRHRAPPTHHHLEARLPQRPNPRPRRPRRETPNLPVLQRGPHLRPYLHQGRQTLAQHLGRVPRGFRGRVHGRPWQPRDRPLP